VSHYKSARKTPRISSKTYFFGLIFFLVSTVSEFPCVGMLPVPRNSTSKTLISDIDFSRLMRRFSKLRLLRATSGRLNPPFASGWIGLVASVISSLMILRSCLIHHRAIIVVTVLKAISAAKKTDISPISRIPTVPGSHQRGVGGVTERKNSNSFTNQSESGSAGCYI